MPSKKAKKKVTKKVNAGAAPANAMAYVDDDDSDGIIPPLEPATMPNRTSRTGLSPDLESVHLSTTASLAAMTNTTPEQLGKTAQDLYRGLEKDTMGMGIPEDSDYWLSLPPAIKSFVENAYAQGVFSGTGTEPERTQQMYNVAQQMMANGHLPRMGSTGKGSTAPYPPGAYPAFDAAMFSDPAFAQALEQLMPPNGPRFGSTQQGSGGQNMQGTTTVSGEYIEGFYTGDDDDEVEEDLDVVNGRADTITGTHVTLSYDVNGVRKMTATNYSGTVPVPPPSIPQVPPDLAAKAKKKQKKQNQNTATPASTTPITKSTPTVPVPPTPATVPPPQRTPVSVPVPASALPNVRQAPIQSAKPELQQAPPLPPPARPAPNPSAPPPSSRAAGKQPMAYPQSAPNAALPPRSARASGKAPATTGAHYHHHPSPPASTKAPPGKPRPPATPATTAKKSSDKIWNTSTQEERERIKVFWLGLSEDERKSLVKLEKDAVLKKMKEQQRQSCSCAVCGRKRTAIEAELEVLYGAYYDELRTYADHQQQYVSSGGKVSPPPGPGPFPGSVEIDNSGAVVPNALTKHPAPPIPPEEYDEEDDDEDDDYDGEGSEEGSEEEDDDDETEPPYPKGARRPVPPTQNPKAAHHPTGKGVNGNGHPPKRGAVSAGAAGPQQDFFTFGPGLTAAGPGNILTVADDLLKNDGQKFLEMMEQLAERRVLREESAAEAIMSEEDSEDDEDSEEDSGSEEDEEEEDDNEIMTEEQKMEEGRRMFSIFAARMFEQRVLHAYRERVAQDRQNQLLRELEEEDKAAADREAKRQKENQKKKDKKRAQKEAKDEAAARKAAERASEEAAAKEKKRAEEEEARKVREEERAKKEAEKKAKEEERMLKDMERRKRLAEEKEREKEREAERKKKEKEERERQREEKERLRKEREEKERVEKERQKKLDEEKAAAEALRLKEEATKRAQEEERLAREAQEAIVKKAAEEKALAEKAAAVAAAATAAATAARNQARVNGVGKKSVSKPAVAGPSNSAGPPNGQGMMRPGPPLSIPAPHPPRPLQPQGPPMGPNQRRPTLPNGMQQTLPQGMQNAMGSNSHSPFPQGPPGMGYGPPSPIAPMNFGAGPSQYAMQGPPLTQQGLPVLQPSPLPRGYGQNSMGPGPGPIQGDYHPPVQQPQHSPYQSVPPPIGPPLQRGIPSPAPLQQLMSTSSVGPNSASQQFSPGPPLPNHSAHSRRSSLDPGPIGGRPTNPPHYGAITRPIAPIGTRPSGGSIPGPSSASSSLAPGGPISSGGASASSSKMDGDDALSRVSGELTGSPERLGSSALVDPEDEALPSAGGRRVGVMGSVWSHPGMDGAKSNADGRFGSGPWSAFNSPSQNSAQQLTSPMSATPWSMSSSSASASNWPSSGTGPISRGQVPFGGGLPPPSMGIGAGLSGGGGSIGAPFLQGNFGFSPGGFGVVGPQPPPRQADSPATQ